MAYAVARQPAAPGDFWLWRTAADPRISSDGSWVVYVEGWNERGGDASCTNLRLMSTDGRQRTSLTNGAWRDRFPRWSPDHTRIAWLSDRGGKTQIWARRVDAGQETALTKLDEPPLAFAWSPDGNSIAFTARVPAKSNPPAWAPPGILPLLAAPPAGPAQIFVVPAAGGNARRLSTDELDYRGEPAWMPNGQSIICAERGGEIFALRPVDGVTRQLTHSGEINREPVPSPDGTKIAYTGASAHQSYAVRKLSVMNADGSRSKLLGGTLDRDVRHPQWSNESRTVYFLADDRAVTHVYAARNDGTARQLTNRAERLRGFSLADNGRAVTVRSSATEGSAVFTFMTDVPAGGWTLSDVNQQLLAERDWGAVEEMPYESAGKTIQAWLVKPPQFDASRKYPLLLDIQEAPPRMWGVEFPLRAQIFAAHGFVVLCVNPRGTPGYGEEFGDLLATQVPGDPADDLMRGVDGAVAKGYIDPNRIMIAGGLTAAWLLGHTDRFAAAVTRHPIVDWVTYPNAPRWMRALPWDDPEQYVKHSPVFFAKSFKTPTLVIASPEDPQSDELYHALQARKVRSAMVRIGDTPGALVQELEATLGWLK
jgi:dipeptidyl aminopeptidase/acylaminoacyl peptidase